jgi:hypothetical protein
MILMQPVKPKKPPAEAFRAIGHSFRERSEVPAFLCEIDRAEYCTVFIVYRPPLWSSGQSSWLQIQRSEFDSRGYQILWEVVGLGRSPLSLVSTTEELTEWYV